MANKKKGGGRQALGGGVDAIFGGRAPSTPKMPPSTARIEQIKPNREQPRTQFHDEALEELAQSIRANGIIEPIVVRKRSQGGYEIIAGERRWRAAQKAGLHEVPIHIRDAQGEEWFTLALIENVQREDLNAIEVARAYHHLATRLEMTQAQIAETVGKSRVSVSNSLRLLKLPDDILNQIQDGVLSEGHGRAILQAGSEDAMVKLARAAVKKKLPVREVERRARAVASGAPATPAKPAQQEKSANVRDLERRLSHSLGMTVTVQQGKGKSGELRIAYADFDGLDQLIAKLLG